jgi:hypothetical protein
VQLPGILPPGVDDYLETGCARPDEAAAREVLELRAERMKVSRTDDRPHDRNRRYKELKLNAFLIECVAREWLIPRTFT